MLTTCTFLDNGSTHEAGAISLDISSDSVVAQLLYLGIANNAAADSGAALFCSDSSSGDSALVNLIVATFNDNTPSDIAG